MSVWRASKAKRVYAALPRLAWTRKKQVGGSRANFFAVVKAEGEVGPASQFSNRITGCIYPATGEARLMKLFFIWLSAFVPGCPILGTISPNPASLWCGDSILGGERGGWQSLGVKEIDHR